MATILNLRLHSAGDVAMYSGSNILLCFFAADHLSQWWSAASLDDLHGCGFGPARYLCAQGKTNADNKYYAGSLVGCRPELMPLDSHLNADHERGMLWHVALTSNLPNNDPRKFKMGTPGQVGDCMDRTWQVFSTPERIVSDINKFPKAVDAIIEADGAVVPELDTRTGRRSTLHLPHHTDCEESVRIREAKWDREQELFDSLSANVQIAGSGSEEPEEEAEEEEELDHSVVALDEGTV